MKPSDKLINVPAVMYVRKQFKLDRVHEVGEAFDTTAHPARFVRKLWDQRKLGTPEEFQQDKERYAAKLAAETSAKTSAKKKETMIPDVFGGEGFPDKQVTADDLEI